MKKNVLLVLILFIAAFSANAQTSGGPDTYGYMWYDSNDPNGPAYNWIDITTLPGVNQVKDLADDNVVGPFQMGFNFHYYWYDVSSYRIGSNGYITFSNGNLAVPFPPIPQATKLNNYIAAFACDLNFDGSGNLGQCYSWVSPTLDTLIVSYIDVPFWEPGINFQGENSFQIILSAVDSSITFQYEEQIGTYNGTFSQFLSIGIENNSGNIGLQHSYDIYPLVGYAVKFVYPPTVTYQAYDASTEWVGTPGSGGEFLVKGAPYEMKVSVNNTGNQVLNPFNIFTEIKSGFSQVNSATGTTDTLQVGASQLVSYPNNLWTPANAGTYSLINTTQLSNDVVASNNKDTSELVVIDTVVNQVQWLSFDNGVPANAAGLSWNGGGPGEGVGMEFPLPYYPCRINEMRAFVVANATPEGMALKLYDDDGFNGAPFTLLDSIWVDPFSVQVGTWTTVPLTVPIIVDSGSIYMMWEMGGGGIGLGQNVVRPISERSYEVLGGAWSIYRDRGNEDFMLNISISAPTQSVDELGSSSVFGVLYPNPSSNFATIEYNAINRIADLQINIYSLDGKLVSNQQYSAGLSGSGSIKILTQNISNGAYTCELVADGKKTSYKLMVAH